MDMGTPMTRSSPAVVVPPPPTAAEPHPTTASATTPSTPVKRFLPTMGQLYPVDDWTSITRRPGPLRTDVREQAGRDRPTPHCSTPSETPVCRASRRTDRPVRRSVEPPYVS